MSKMNIARVLIGGCLAGIVMNIGEAALHGAVLGREAEALYKGCNVPAPNPASTLPMLVSMTFIVGIVSVWLYAAISPRFGLGAKTAVLAGLVVWVLAHVWSGVYLGAGYSGLVTPGLAWIPVGWGLVEAVLGTLVGSLAYKER